MPGSMWALVYNGDIGVLRQQRPALGGHEGPHGRLLRLQAEATLALLGGGDPIEGDGEARLVAEHLGHGSVRREAVVRSAGDPVDGV